MKDGDIITSAKGQHKSLPLAYLLWFVLGSFGAHRFYLRAARSASILFALTLIGALTFSTITGKMIYVVAALWLITDAFRIPGMARDANDPASP